MALEAGTFISDLSASNPPSGDVTSQGDDHIRLIKSVLAATFPNADKAFYFPDGLAKTAAYTVLAADMQKIITGDATGAAFTFTLPTLASTDDGWKCTIVKIDVTQNDVTIAPASGTISGLSSIALMGRYDTVTVQWSGSAWFVTTSPQYVKYPVVTKAASATLTDEEFQHLIIVTGASGDVTLTLPTAVGFEGQWYSIKRNDSDDDVIIDGDGTETIDGALTVTLSVDQDALILVSDGANWHVISATFFVGGVDTADINDDAVTLAKMAAGTAGGHPIYDASGDPADSGAGTIAKVWTAKGAGAVGEWNYPFANFTDTVMGPLALNTDYSDTLSAEPSWVEFFLLCDTDDGTWTAGTRIPLAFATDTSNTFGASAGWDGAVLEAHIRNTGNIAPINTTGVPVPLTVARWSVVARSWA